MCAREIERGGGRFRERYERDLVLPVHDVHAGPAKDNVEVHAVDADAGVVPTNKSNLSIRKIIQE